MTTTVPTATAIEPRASRRPLVLLLVLAATIKLGYLLQYSALPFLSGPIFDASVYVRQARAVLAGRFDDPTLLAFSPLFGWFAAIFGAKTLPIVLAQFALGLGEIVLLYRIASRVASSKAALFSCALFIGYGLPLSYESKLLSETLGLFLAFLTMERFTSERFIRGDAPVSVAAGIVFAAAVLARASMLFALPFFPLVALAPWSAGEARRPRFMRASLFIVGSLAVFGANGVVTFARTGIFVPVILVSRTIERTTAVAFDGALRNPDAPEATSGSWDVVRQAERRIANARAGKADSGGSLERIDLRGLLMHAPRKVLRTLADHELTFDYPYYGERALVPMLNVLPISFGGIELLGLLGACFLVHSGRGRELYRFLPLVLGTLVVCIVYHPSSRYRLCMIVPFLPLAGVVVDALASARMARNARIGIGGLVAAAMIFFAVRLYTYEIRQPGALEAIIAESYARAGNRREAEAHARRALELEPTSTEVRARLNTFGRIREAPR